MLTFLYMSQKRNYYQDCIALISMDSQSLHIFYNLYNSTVTLLVLGKVTTMYSAKKAIKDYVLNLPI